MRHILMLPFCRQGFVFSYVAMLGVYTIVTKTGLLLGKYWYAGVLWIIVIVGAILLLGNRIWLSLLLFVNGMFSVLFLWKVDGYGFYQQGKKKVMY